ncbi:TLC domain-containing protein 3A [Plutella xylostella]|uniref:TLC domain-containing protein 3A n=1 Tax=Plutella xylostella TaxID=51655 RepID=UPI0020330592|nr:TLC domain-containing protein 3A [Plutella xylostella]
MANLDSELFVIVFGIVVWVLEFAWDNQYWFHLATLGVPAGGSILLAVASVLQLRPDDRVTVCHGAFLSTLGVMFYLSLYWLVQDAVTTTPLGRRLVINYSLTRADVTEISHKVVSCTEGLLSCLAGAIVVLYSCSRDPLRASHFVSEAYAWFSISYFFCDLWMQYKVFSEDKIEEALSTRNLMHLADPLTPRQHIRGPPFLYYCRADPLTVIHHLVLGSFVSRMIVYLRGSHGDCLFGFLYLMELSTPFVSLRGIYRRLRMRYSRAYLANVLAMMVTFFICRVVSLPYVCLVYYNVIHMPYFKGVQSLPNDCKLVVTLMLVPQLVWFYKMVRGYMRLSREAEARRGQLAALETKSSLNFHYNNMYM